MSSSNIIPQINSRSRSPIFISTPTNTKQTQQNRIYFRSPSPTFVLRSSSVTPYKKLANYKNSEISTKEEETAFWKNKYESLNAIYQLEIEELRRFYAGQGQNSQISQESSEECKQLKNDNKVLSEYIRKIQEDLDIVKRENAILQEKLSKNLIGPDKIEELLAKNLELNSLMDRKTEEIAELMLANTNKNDLLAEKNQEIDHVKGLLAQIIQDNDRLSEIIQDLRGKYSEISKELENKSKEIQCNSRENEQFKAEIEELRNVKNELESYLETIKSNNSMNNYREIEENPKYEVLFENFKQLKEENYKLKEEKQRYYGDSLLLKEREKILKSEIEKMKKSSQLLSSSSKGNSAFIIK